MKKILCGVLVFFSFLVVSKDVVFASGVERYYKSTIYYDKQFNIVDINEEEVTKEEIDSVNFDELSLEKINYGDGIELASYGWPAYVETDYKKVGVDCFKSNLDKSYTYVSAEAMWYKEPRVKQFDIIALRWDGSAQIVDVGGKQSVIGKTQAYEATYFDNNKNIKRFSNGAGISMNLFDNGVESFMLDILIKVKNANLGTVYASYQHAVTNNITLSESQKYTLSSSGLGNVINFTSSTTRKKYDGMAGPSYSCSNPIVINTDTLDVKGLL